MGVGGIRQGPGDGAALRAVQAHIQTVAPVRAWQEFVVGRGGFQFPCSVERGDGDHVAVGQTEESGNPFVVGEVVLAVLPVPYVEGFEVVRALEEDGEVGRRLPMQDQQMTAHRPDCRMNKLQRAEPQGVVQRGIVQRGDDAIKVVLVAHDGGIERAKVVSLFEPFELGTTALRHPFKIMLLPFIESVPTCFRVTPCCCPGSRYQAKSSGA